MKLDEILLVANTAKGNANIVKRRIDQAKHIKDDIYSFDVLNHDFFCIIIKGELKAFLHGSKVNVRTLSNSFVVKEVWVHPSHRRSGYASQLYSYVYNDLGYTVISDIEQTLGGKAIWKSLRKQFGDDVMVYDDVIHTLIKFDTIPEEELYRSNSVDNLDKRYRLVLKSGETLKESVGIPNVGCGILAPMVRFASDDVEWI